MELLIISVGIVVVLAAIMATLDERTKEPKRDSVRYKYVRKNAIMTTAEAVFYDKLLSAAGDRYYIFPQIHLSALLENQTRGRYWKAAFQRINRTSVDYVLCDKQSMRPIYVVELDDRTHDTSKRRARDKGVEAIFSKAGIPLVRFRETGSITDEQIADRFIIAAQNNTKQ